MELNQVRYFLALARSLNFTRAAEECEITQPGLTKAVQKLEREFGGPLIHRERQHTQLTDLGKSILSGLQQMVDAAEAVHIGAAEFQAMRIAPLRIGLTPSIPTSLIIDSLSELSRSVPGLQLDLSEDRPDRLIEALLNGDIHAAISNGINPLPARIDHWLLFEERYITLSAPNHPFARLKEVPLAALESTVWVSREDCEIYVTLAQVCFPVGVKPKIGHYATRELHLQYMAAAGFGVHLAPEHVPRLQTLVARPIEGDPVRRPVNLLVVAGRRYSPALSVFIKNVRCHNWLSPSMVFCRMTDSAEPFHSSESINQDCLVPKTTACED
jgi:DNA-binding transcriptional LysR family regulator